MDWRWRQGMKTVSPNWPSGSITGLSLATQLEELQLAASENRIRMQESLIDPDLAAGRTAMAQAIDDAFGQERVDEQGASRFPSGPPSATRSLSSPPGC